MATKDPSKIRLLISRPSGICFLAYTCFQVWAVSFKHVVSLSILSTSSTYVVESLFEGLSALIIGLVFVAIQQKDRKKRPDPPRIVFILLGIAMVASGFGLGSLNLIAGVFVMLVIGFITAWCVTRCAMLSFDLYSSGEVIGFLLLSYTAAAVVRYPLEFLPVQAICIITSPLPFACAMLCRKAQEVIEADEPKGTPELLRDKMASSLSYLVVLVVFGFVIGCLLPSAQRTSGDTLAVTIMVFLQITIPLTVLFVLLRLYRRINLAYICQLALVLILAAIAFTASQVGTDDSTVISVAVFLPRHFIRMLLIVILAVLSPQLSRRPALFFSIGYAALLFSMAVGFFISGSPWFSYPLPQTTFVSIVLVVLIVVLAAISLDMMSQKDSQLFPTTVATEERLSHTDIIIDKCNGIALHHNLSKREYEVMCLICIGRSKSYIAEHLILSENTVRSYAKTLYSKLDIHSRQELLDLIE